MIFRHQLILFLLSAISLLSACGTVPERPPVKEGVTVELIPEPVPVAEPRSKYGNPESYVERGQRYWVMPSSAGYVAEGKASWYGKKFDGKRTSSGETYNMYDMTAAHTTLPLPTYVQVTNLSNQRKVIVRVNDRGPFVKNRLIDLSYAAASKLDMVTEGTAAVEVKVLNPRDYQPQKIVEKPVAAVSATTPAPMSMPTKPVAVIETTGEVVYSTNEAELNADSVAQEVFIQVGAYAKMESAEAVMVDVMEVQSNPVFIVPIESTIGVLHRVRVGPFQSDADAQAIYPGLQDRGYFQYRIVRQ
ncbi:MAG TPA: septal ring lytic transglycosylase RlpA family lipoprotein [Gammaproteobacteria bacterium]|nr:septal ring lytic transglycosylase RlpA family lipoprotein [Gammaproteobacteria bacterium]